MRMRRGCRGYRVLKHVRRVTRVRYQTSRVNSIADSCKLSAKTTAASILWVMRSLIVGHVIGLLQLATVTVRNSGGHYAVQPIYAPAYRKQLKSITVKISIHLAMARLAKWQSLTLVPSSSLPIWRPL
jgi:hypothetical protein